MLVIRGNLSIIGEGNPEEKSNVVSIVQTPVITILRSKVFTTIIWSRTLGRTIETVWTVHAGDCCWSYDPHQPHYLCRSIDVGRSLVPWNNDIRWSVDLSRHNNLTIYSDDNLVLWILTRPPSYSWNKSGCCRLYWSGTNDGSAVRAEDPHPHRSTS